MAKHRRPHRLDADDVIEGRVRPSARDLLALIHEVNPSGHDLPAREAARRYAQKSRLQSLLIHRFADEILVEPGDEPGVIGLRHRTSGADACHAVLATLDDDARSWAQLQIDLGGPDEEAEGARSLTPVSSPEGPRTDAPDSELPTDELLRRGRAALKDYDYPAARERFAAAFERGSGEAARLLLTVLVEHLGLDEEALAVEELLDEALYDGAAGAEVRLLLGLAAARLGQRARALHLVRAEGGDAAADVFVALARGAIERGDLDHAAADVAEIQRRGPSHPALLGLADTVKKRRAEERAPLEAEAQRLLDEGRFDEAEARAEALAARWPESLVAQAITRAGHDRRRRDEARALAQKGSAALQAGEAAGALGLLRRAISMGLRGEDAAQAQRDVALAEAAERAEAENDKARMVAHLLQQGGPTLRALTDFAALDPGRRHVILTAFPLVELAYLEQTGVHGTGPDARAAAQAVIALCRALEITGTDPATAVDLITLHWAHLKDIPNAGRALSTAREISSLRAQADANRRFTDGLRAINGTREGLARGIRILAGIRREDLDAPEKLDRVLAASRRMEERLDRGAEIGKLRSSGRLVEARDAVDAVMRLEETWRLNPGEYDGPERATVDWQSNRDELVLLIARQSDLRISGPASDEHLLGVEAPPLVDVPESLLPGAAEVVLVETHGGRIFFQIVDAASGRVVRRATLRMKGEFMASRVQQRSGKVAVLGTGGTCIEIDPATWEVARALGSPNDPLTQGVLAPGGRFLWTTEVRDGWWTAVIVEDTERNLHVKDFSESSRRLTVRPLLGLEEPRVIAVRDRGMVTVYEARGAPFGPTHEGLPLLPRSVVVHPRGTGLFALLREPREGGPADVRWAELTPDATPLRAPAGEDRAIAGIDPDAPCEAAVDLDARVVFVLGTPVPAPSGAAAAAAASHASGAPGVPGGEAGARRLLGFAMRGEALEPCFDVEVPARVTLATAPTARGVVALSPHEHGVEIVRLGASPPVFRVAAPETPPLGLDALVMAPRRPCAPRERALWTVSAEGVAPGHLGIEYLHALETVDRRKMIADALDAADARDLVVPRFAALLDVPKAAFADDFALAAAARFPGDPEMAQIPAHRAAHAGDWGVARDLLAPIDPTPLGDAAARHHDHLLGVALLMTGDVTGARRALERGAARAGWCDLSAALALASEGPPQSPTGMAVRALDRALRAADACLAAGDPAGARRALSGLVVREAREVQTLARRARAWLSEPDETARAGEAGETGEALDGFARRLALAAFITAHAEKAPTRRRELPFAYARWDAVELDALATEALAWLDGDLKRPRPGDDWVRP